MPNDIELSDEEDLDVDGREDIRMKKIVPNTSNSAIGGKLKVGAMNELQKYKEIQRRTKLIYGVKDIKRMVDKSDASKHFY